MGLLRKKFITGDNKTPPMVRLLGQHTAEYGQVWIEYDQQWKTFAKAQRLGYLDGLGFLTEEGKKYLNKFSPFN